MCTFKNKKGRSCLDRSCDENYCLLFACIFNRHNSVTDNQCLMFVSEGPQKPRMPKVLMEFVEEPAKDWLTNLVDID